MKKKLIQIDEMKIGSSKNFVLIAGPCVIENRKMVLNLAKKIKAMTERLEIPLVFKASYDKANRTSIESFRGIGIDKGIDILKEVKDSLGIPVLSDVHSQTEVAQIADFLDIIQIPAFLCRQTDLLLAAAQTQKVINVKKGQFLAPWDMQNVIRKIESAGNQRILLTERGTSFGYNNLVADFRSLAVMGKMSYPVIFDATHSVQQPGGLGHVSGGNREYVPLLARAAMAAGCDGIFMEVHMQPQKAMSDGANMLALNKLEKLLKDLKALYAVAQNYQCKA